MIKESDGPNDQASGLDRDEVYRLSCGLEKEVYCSLFGEKPKRPAKGCVVDLPYDFLKLNDRMPHPVYAWMNNR